MITDQKHSSDSMASEQEVIRYTKKLAQIFTKLKVIEHAYNPMLPYILDSNKASCPIICMIIFGGIA